ncbi:MAG: cupin domain-containing protein [Oscillospiraceae bacterium]|nr:cupin domain-containing protein [Oscillospiraceae bacterium]
MKKEPNTPFTLADSCEFEDQGGGVKRKILAYGDALMQVEVHFEKGSVGAMHSHPHSQLTYVLEGEFEFTIGGEKKIVRKGDTLYKVPHILHGCVCLEKGILLDTFNPYREDFLK